MNPAFEAIFIAAVALACWFGGRWSGVGALVASTITVLYFYIPPYDRIVKQDLAGWSQVIAFVATSSLIIVLIHWLFRAQTDVEDIEIRFRSASDLIRFGAWAADRDGNLVELSAIFLKNFGTTMQKCAGLGWLDLIVEDERENVKQDWQTCVQEGGFWDREYHMKATDGRVYSVLSRGVPVQGPGKRYRSWMGIHLDVTDREAATEQRLAHERDIARFNAELDQFAYVASHDLQEPLRMIASYIQLLAKRYRDKLDDDAATFIDYAVEGANRLQALLQSMQLLSVIGKFPDRRQPQNLGAIVDRAKFNLQSRIAETGAAVECNDLPVVTCDRFEMTQLFENLLDNALKFARKEEAPRIAVTAERELRFWRIAVRDNGVGMEGQYLQRIFDLFQRLHPRAEYPGTGIGLTICKKIIEVHGGRIWAESQPGGGTTILFTLPAV